MKFIETTLPGAYVVEIEPIEDQRGFFARSWCAQEFAQLGLADCVAQCSISYNRLAGTLRGLHYQTEPNAEAKVVRCTRGTIFDVIVDLRLMSPTRGRWFGCELSAELHNALYVPPLFAHGFQTLEDDSEVLYQMSVPYSPGPATGIRWDDPEIGIEWARKPSVISDGDANLPLYRQ